MYVDLTPEERVAAAKAAAEKVSAKLPTPLPAQPTVDPKAQAIEEKRKLLWNKKKEVRMYVHTNLRAYVCTLGIDQFEVRTYVDLNFILRTYIMCHG